jgi:hypothetical protein
VFFEDREPAGPDRVTLPARRTKHLRFNDLHDPKQFHAAPPTHRSSSRRCLSWCSTHALTPAIPASRS